MELSWRDDSHVTSGAPPLVLCSFARLALVCQRPAFLITERSPCYPVTLYLLLSNQVPIPEDNSAPLLKLGKPVDTFACYYQLATSSTSSSGACTYISISRKQMQQHLNQQHSIKLTRWTSLSATSYSNHAAQL
jgi:hypothetical protein